MSVKNLPLAVRQDKDNGLGKLRTERSTVVRRRGSRTLASGDSDCRR